MPNKTNNKVKNNLKLSSEKTQKKVVKKSLNKKSKTFNVLSKFCLYDKYIFALLISFICGLIIFKIYLPKTISIIILLSNLYLVIKYRKNIPLFFCLMSILYFNYSFIFSKYLFNTSTLTNIYSQTRFFDTKMIGLYCVYLFISIIGFFLSGELTDDGIDMTKLPKKFSNKFSKIMGYLIIIMIAFLLVLAYWLRIDFIRALHEYSLILFIFGFLICRNNKPQIIILVVLMLLSTGLNLITGGRIISLLPCIAFFFIFLSPYFNYIRIIFIMIIGVVFFTAFGLYGDIMDGDQDFSVLTPKYVVDTISERKFTLDTSISSYWTGLTFIEQRRYDLNSTTSDFKDYIVKYSVFGNKLGNYKHVYEKSREHYVHYYGGYLTSYFFYWMGYVGVALISCYVGILFNILRNSNSNNSSYKILLSIYICSTIPRWYLYYPSPLLRGVLFLSLLYIFIIIVSKWRFLNEGK